MAQRNNKNLIAPNQDASKHICHLWSQLPRIGALVSHRFTINVVPHLDPTSGKVGGTFPPLDYFGKGRLAPPAGETHTVFNQRRALSPPQPCWLRRMLPAYFCQNCLNTITLPSSISPRSSNVKQETQPPNLNTRQVA